MNDILQFICFGRFVFISLGILVLTLADRYDWYQLTVDKADCGLVIPDEGLLILEASLAHKS